MFPINYVELFTLGIGKQVIELADQQGAAVLAIKPISAGSWPKEVGWNDRPRKWWYRTLEDQEEINLAFRFTLSQKAVVAGIPPAWLDLTERAIEAGKQLRPITAEETDKLRTMAADRSSVFRQWQQVAHYQRRALQISHRSDEGCPGMMS
jgi:hypothetical protein